jgi:class 3 adenylate cyclase
MRDLWSSVTEVAFEEIGEIALKGIPAPVAVYRAASA